ncbi:hypothetical protein ACFOEK_18355 [Litoribrevibacter euphylliae]|uniref:Uncharacterized protein n=1 Tax=Litoribrevibacter euphylliae TaxID=1834034 RepID=A0ABV7HJU2_9GAMM
MKSLFLIMLIVLTTKTWAYTCEQEVARTYFKLVDEAKNNRHGLIKFFSPKSQAAMRLFYEENYYDGPFRGLDTVNGYKEYKVNMESRYVATTFNILSYYVGFCDETASLEIYYLDTVNRLIKKVMNFTLYDGTWLIDSQLIVAVDKDDVRGVELNYPIHSEEMEGCLIDAYLIKDPDMRLLEYYACFDSIEDPEIVTDG